jgi:putative phosphoesterase
MRILLLADIHGNWPALQALHALEEPHDLCIVLGDLVDYALDPVPCIEWVQEHAHYTIRGNHDHGVAQRAITNGTGGFKYLTAATRPLTWERLNSGYLRYLGSLPVTYQLSLDTTRFLLVHATPRDPLDEYAPCDADFWERRLENVQADVVCVAHTHQPYVLPVGDKLVINPGSVGQPRDGDPRACYAVWDNGQVELKRVSYRIEEVVASIENSKLPDQAKQISIEVFRTGTLPRVSGNNVPPRSKPVAVVPVAEPEAEARWVAGAESSKPQQAAEAAEDRALEDSAPAAERPATEPGNGEAGEKLVPMEANAEVDGEEAVIPPATESPAATEPPGEEPPREEAKTIAEPKEESAREHWWKDASRSAPTDMAETLPGPFNFMFDASELVPEEPEKPSPEEEPPARHR